MLGVLLCAAYLTLPLTVKAGPLGQYSLEQVLHYPYDSQLASAQGADIIAWVRNGYGRAFHQPDLAGLAGASEYQDVVAGGRFLQDLRGVDPSRIGIWGSSYGGYLTALALARNSDIFKAGVDLRGVHDWSRLIDEWTGKPVTRYEKGDREKAMEVAWTSSPVSSLDNWRSPVLLIQGDDDRNVPFIQTVDLARRLTKNPTVPVMRSTPGIHARWLWIAG